MNSATTTRATETSNASHDVHGPTCHIKGEWLDICRCRTWAKADAEVTSIKRIAFVGPIGKSNPARAEVKRDTYLTARRLF